MAQLSFDDWRPRDWNPRFGKLEIKFREFHRANPVVYQYLVYYAREWKHAGHSYCSINLLFERVRWQLHLKPDEYGIKLNNNHRAFYARLIENQEADLENFFKKRRQKIQCSFGPRNEDLPPGEHLA